MTNHCEFHSNLVGSESKEVRCAGIEPAKPLEHLRRRELNLTARTPKSPEHLSLPILQSDSAPLTLDRWVFQQLRSCA